VEAALKVVTQYHDITTPPHRPRRTKFIAREQSYHGATLGALDLSGHEARKALYQFILPQNMHLITSCHPYRNRLAGENDEQYVARKKSELRDKIIDLGKDEVSAVIFEPVVGAVSDASMMLDLLKALFFLT
jgi:adenosylmethionine-8-amino-7-oxononanoate aminotransferase